MAQRVELALKALGYVTLLAASNEDPEEELRALATFRARQVDGMLVYPHDHRRLDHLKRLRAGGMPVVLLAGDGGGEVDVVRLDEHDGAFRATRHLIDAGHRRIGLVDSAPRHGNLAKGEGFAAALASAGLALAPELVLDPMGHSLRHGHDAFARLMARPRPPTAVLTANDRLALGGLRWCQQAGVAVPGDLAVFGYDNVEYGEFASTPLSSVDYPSEDLARQAVARLMELIQGEPTPSPPRLVRIRPELVLRESTRVSR